MLPIPSKEQARGLSAPDLVICLSYYAAAKGEPCHYRNRLWSEWQLSGLSYTQIAGRWNGLPQTTRQWIALARYCGPLVVAPSDAQESNNVLGDAIHRVRKHCQPLDPGNVNGEKPNPGRRRLGRLFWRNVLLWNWHSAESEPTFRNVKEIIRRWLSLPQQVRAAVAGDKDDSGKELGSSIDHGISRSPRLLTPQERGRFVPDGTSASQRPKSVLREFGAGDVKNRRHYWLGLFESRDTDTAGNIRAIIADWQGKSDEERWRIGGPKGYRKLRRARGVKGVSSLYLRNQIKLAMWEGQVEGKGATYGRRLWFLLQRKKRKLPQAEIRRAWNTLTGRERELICPTAPERLPDSSRGSRQVGNDLWRLGRDTESLGFLDRYQGLFSVRQRACRVPDQQILAWRDEHKSVVQIIELSGLPLVPDQIKRSKNLVNQAIGRARRRRGDKPKAGACGHTPTPLCSRRNDLWREWYEKEKLGPAKILDRWNALGAVERVKYVDDPKYAASLPATFGMRVQSQQRIWQAIQRAKRQRELNVTQPQAALPTGNDEKTKPAAPPPIVAAAHQAKKRRNREKTSQTVKIEAAYKAGADVNQVVARFGISKDYAWQIRYRMKLKVRRET